MRRPQLRDRFSLKALHDDVLAAGVIPISLIRWEMTGNDDQIRSMW